MYKDNGQQLGQTFLDQFDFLNNSLSSTIDKDLRNASSRSMICCPYNSSLDICSQLEEQNELKEYEIYQPNEILRMSPKVKMIDEKYQLENNALFDQGVING